MFEEVFQMMNDPRNSSSSSSSSSCQKKKKTTTMTKMKLLLGLVVAFGLLLMMMILPTMKQRKNGAGVGVGSSLSVVGGVEQDVLSATRNHQANEANKKILHEEDDNNNNRLNDAPPPRPTGLLCNYQKSSSTLPALGIGSKPQFSWIVPPSGKKKDLVQTAYRIRVWDYDKAKAASGRDIVPLVWDSHKVYSNQSIAIPYNGGGSNSNNPLQPRKKYSWNVQTWSRSTEDDEEEIVSSVSESATFITSQSFDSSDNNKEWDHGNTVYIGGGNNNNTKSSTYSYFRRTFEVADDNDGDNNNNNNIPNIQITSAIVYVTAASRDETLCAYKLYVNGHLVSVGPGRPEAPIWGGDGKYRTNPYQTLDVTNYLSAHKTNLLAISSVFRGSGSNNAGVKGPHVLLQLIVRYTAGAASDDGDDDDDDNTKTIRTKIIGTNSQDWYWREADTYYNPTPSISTEMHGMGIKESGVEYIDARHEIVGWNTDPNLPMDDDSGGSSKWSPAIPCGKPCSDPTSKLAPNQRHATMNQPVQIIYPNNKDSSSSASAAASDSVSSSEYHEDYYTPTPIVGNNEKNLYLIKFPKEIQGGLIITCEKGISGILLEITSGELFNSTTSGEVPPPVGISNTWGYTFNWTLRDGQQTLEQHKYMEFQYVTIRIINNNNNYEEDGGITPTSLGMKLSAWKVQARYDPTDTYFDSSSALLNQIWDVCRYTLQAGVTETYTDSNTRERRPYEADGLITSTGRQMIQRNYMWSRHSHSYIIQNPTWPTEWQQTTTNLLWDDYQTTNSIDLFFSYENIIFHNTKWTYHLDSNPNSIGYGLILTNWTTTTTTTTTTTSTASNGTGGTGTGPDDNDDNDPFPARHIVGWDPHPLKEEFRDSDYQFPCNAFAYRGLRILATLAKVRASALSSSSSSKKKERNNNKTTTNDDDGDDETKNDNIAAEAAAAKAVAEKYSKAAKDLKAAILSKMWDRQRQRFCDGICSMVDYAGGPYSDMYSLYLGLVPGKSAPSVWKRLSDYSKPGNSNYGAYGSFALQYALTDFNLYGHDDDDDSDDNNNDNETGSGLVEKNGGGDDGTTILRWLTKCDKTSWCIMIRKYGNSTMTGEAFENFHRKALTRSHPWGTAAIPAIVQGVAGIQRDAPGYSRFTVKPRLGKGGGVAEKGVHDAAREEEGGGGGSGLDFLSLRLPTLMGYIDMEVRRTTDHRVSNDDDNKGSLELSISIPCNVLARLCLPILRSSREGLHGQEQLLFLDGVAVKGIRDGRHMCVKDVGCGIMGKPRVLTSNKTRHQQNSF